MTSSENFKEMQTRNKYYKNLKVPFFTYEHNKKNQFSIFHSGTITLACFLENFFKSHEEELIILIVFFSCLIRILKPFFPSRPNLPHFYVNFLNIILRPASSYVKADDKRVYLTPICNSELYKRTFAEVFFNFLRINYESFPIKILVSA